MKYLKVLRTVFSKPYYLLIALLVGGLVFTFAVWLPNIQLIIVVAGSAGLLELLALLWNMYGAIGSNFTFVSAVVAIFISTLFGMNVALLVYFIKKMQGGLSSIKGNGVTNTGGLVAGILGIGCAACGTFVLTSVLTIIGAAGILSYLPFGGEELGFVGVGLLLYSLYTLAKKISNPLLC